MNQWQQKYCDTYHNGKKPRSKIEKEKLELLGQVKDYVIVEFPDFNGANGFVPAHTETLEVTLDTNDIPNGKISACTLAGNLRLWTSRGYKISTK